MAYLRRLTIYSFLFLAPLSCTRESRTSTLTIKFPPAAFNSVQSVSSSSSVHAMSGDNPWSGQITLKSEINCYAVMVGGPDANLNINSCKDNPNGNVIMRFGPYAGGIPAGQDVRMVLNAGPSRRVYLLAMNATAGSCKDFHGAGPDQGLISHPRLIGMQNVNLTPGDVTLNFTVPTSLSALSEVGECDVKDMDSGNSGQSPWSDGRDGSITVTTGTSYLDGDNDNLGVVSHTPSAGGVPSSKWFLFTSRVEGIDTTTGNVLTLTTTPSNSDQLSAGDILFWHIGSGWASTNPDSNACGGNLSRGQWGTAKVASITGNAVTLEDPITNSPSTINNTNLAQASPVEGTPHCLMQVVRMSHFDTINLDPSAALNLTIPGWNPSSYKYGIMAVSIKNLTMGTGSSLNINLEGGGHPSGSVGAFGVGTAGNGTSNYMNRPGIVSAQGGGGGNAGQGAATAAPAPGGSALNLCSGLVCKTFADKKAFFGGGGAGNGTSPGGNGGGLIFVMIENASGTGLISLNANGASASNTDAGGGAGGTIALLMKSQASSVTVNAHANGRDGFSPSGGGGGGGLVDIGRCLTTSTGAVNTQVFAGTGGSGATNGLVNSYNLETTNPDYCN